MEKTYIIGEKKYTQKPLVLGQVKQLLDLLKGVMIPADAGSLELVMILGDKLPLALAIVLAEEGKSLRSKDIPAMADEIEFAVIPDQVLEIVDDFFLINPISSISEKLMKMVERIGGQMKKIPEDATTGSRRFASSSQTEISPSGTELPGQ
jgi:hypothetical protein